ncbi:hypothetical protein DMP08_07685 [Paraeggerthella hongkongensis]|uniref:Transposase n=2 Tax=Paraeggerthella hongkongensis TaxID=230658 RepID=A0A3N0B7K1_9ACTN|nr:hypothetical protein DMP08_07685 [Paraeggerthella hongkongensis]
MMLLRKGKAMARYTEEFKREAVRLYKSRDIGVVKTAQGIGVAPESLRAWIRKYDENVRSLDIAERERLRQAETEIKRLKEENEILIKAAAFFVREADRRK